MEFNRLEGKKMLRCLVAVTRLWRRSE